MIVKQMLTMLITTIMVLGSPAQQTLTLVAAEPPPQSTLREPVQRVTMQFSEPIAEGRFTLNSAEDIPFVPAETQIDEARVVLEYPAGLPDGGYEVAWEVLGVSGVVATGTFSFTLRLPPPTLRFTAPQDGQVLTPGPFTLDATLEGITLDTPDIVVRFEVADQTIITGALPIEVADIGVGVHTVEAVVLRGGNPVDTTRQQVTVVLAEPTPTTDEPTASITVAPTTGAEAIASVVGVLALLFVGIFLGVKQKPLN